MLFIKLFGHSVGGRALLIVNTQSLGDCAFEIKVTGFTTDAQKMAKLIVSAYVIATKGEETVVSYLQPEPPTEGSRYNIITFNDFNTSK